MSRTTVFRAGSWVSPRTTWPVMRAWDTASARCPGGDSAELSSSALADATHASRRISWNGARTETDSTRSSSPLPHKADRTCNEIFLRWRDSPKVGFSVTSPRPQGNGAGSYRKSRLRQVDGCFGRIAATIHSGLWSHPSYTDWTVSSMPPILTRRRFLSASAAATVSSSIWAKATTERVPDSQLLSDIERRTFYFYWERVNQSNGLMADRLSTPAACSITGTGFALTAWPIGVERGWIT